MLLLPPLMWKYTSTGPKRPFLPASQCLKVGGSERTDAYFAFLCNAPEQRFSREHLEWFIVTGQAKFWINCVKSHEDSANTLSPWHWLGRAKGTAAIGRYTWKVSSWLVNRSKLSCSLTSRWETAWMWAGKSPKTLMQQGKPVKADGPCSWHWSHTSLGTRFIVQRFNVDEL